jgi:hypothetical protein
MWAEVAEEMDSTTEAVRNKWKSLRDGFTKRLKKIPVSAYGHTEVEFNNYTTWHYFKHLFFLKDQYTPNASSTDITPHEKKNLEDDLTDTRHEGSESLQHSFKRLRHEKEQITSHASTADIPLKEKKAAREDQTDTGDAKLQSSQHTSKGPCHEKVQISSHASSKDLPPEGKKTLKNDQQT